MPGHVKTIDTFNWRVQSFTPLPDEGEEVVFHFTHFAVVVNKAGAALVMQRGSVVTLTEAPPTADRLLFVFDSDPRDPSPEVIAVAERMRVRSLELFPKNADMRVTPIRKE